MSTILSHSLAWALLHSLWQGLLLYGLLLVLLKAMPNISAPVKYKLSLGSFAMLFIWFADTWFAQYRKLKGSIMYITAPQANNSGEPLTFNTVINPHNDASLLHRLLPDIQQYYPLIVLLYSLGLTFMVFRFLVNIGKVRALRTQGIAIPAQEWADFVAKWQARFNIASPVQLFLSNRISVPMMMGAVKPMILLPIATINHLSTEQVEAILLHELAHIRRHDYIVNMLQTIGETLLFFNPFVWLISSVIRKEREHCCDDQVVESAADPLPYARALAILESNRHESNLAIAATGNNNQLFNRIKRIMEMKKSNLTNSQLTIIVVAILAITFSVAMFTFTPSFAQKAGKTVKKDTIHRNTYHYKTVIIDDNGNRTEEEHESDEPVSIRKNGNKTIVRLSGNDSLAVDDDNSYTKTFEYNTDSPGAKKIIHEVIVNKKDLKEIDWDDLNKDINEVSIALTKADKDLKEVDWEAMNTDLDAALKQLDKELRDPKMSKEIKEDIKNEMKNAKKEMKQAKIQMEIAHTEMVKANKEMTKQKKGIVKKIRSGNEDSYSYNTNSFDQMIDKMAADKIIDKSTVYVIRKADNELFINGKKQPEEVYERYKSYLNFKTVDIKGKRGTLNIHIHN